MAKAKGAQNNQLIRFWFGVLNSCGQKRLLLIWWEGAKVDRWMGWYVEIKPFLSNCLVQWKNVWNDIWILETWFNAPKVFKDFV
jgi:hypothetical protein